MSMQSAGQTGDGFDDPAVRLSRLVGEKAWSDVVDTLDAHWAVLISTSPELLRTTVAALPASVFDANPRWEIARDYLNHILEHPAGDTTRFRGSSVTVQSAASPSLLDVLAQLTSRAAAARAGGRQEDAIAAVREARELLDDADEDARALLRIALPELQFQWGMVWEYAGEIDSATREYVDSYDESVRASNPMAQLMAASALAWVHAMAGRNIQARLWLDRLTPDDGQWWHARAAVPAVLARTLLLTDSFRLTEAREQLDRIRLDGAPERWPFQKLLAAYLSENSVRSTDLLVQIDSSTVAGPGPGERPGAMSSVVGLARVLLFRSMSNQAAARRLLDSLDTNAGSLAEQLILCLRASDATRIGDYALAARIVTPLRTTATSTPRTYVAALAITAACLLDQGDDRAAASAFDEASTLARRHRLYYPFVVLIPEDLDRLLALVPDALPASVVDVLHAYATPSTPDPFQALSARERIVLDQALTGSPLKTMAEALFVSAHTVKSQLRSIYAKTGVSSRSDLTALALRHGYVASTK